MSYAKLDSVLFAGHFGCRVKVDFSENYQMNAGSNLTFKKA